MRLKHKPSRAISQRFEVKEETMEGIKQMPSFYTAVLPSPPQHLSV